MTIPNRAPSWQRIDDLTDQLSQLKPTLLSKARDFDTIATEVTSVMYLIWRAAQNSEIRNDFYEEVSLVKGRSFMAKMVTFLLHYSKEDLAGNYDLKQKHAQMAGTLEILKVNYDPDRDPTKEEVLAEIANRGGMGGMYMAYLNHRSALASQERERERAQVREREEFLEFQRQKRLQTDADLLGITVEKLIARREQEAQDAAKRSRQSAFDKALNRLIANGTPADRDDLQDGIFYVARTGQLYRVRSEDQEELLACKIQN